MSDKTIRNLPDYDAKGEDLLQQDIFAISHNETTDPVDYLTYKVSLKTLERTVSADSYAAQREALSNDLALKDLAWVDKITDEHIDANKLDFARSVRRDTYGGLALSDESNLDLHDLAHKDEAQLKLSALAHKSVIDLASSENLSGLIPLSRINSQFGDLLSTNQADLDLHTLAHKDQVNLGSYGAAGGVYGKLDFKQGITNYDQYVLPQAKATKDPSGRGGINLGFYEGAANHSQNYALKVNEDGQAYVHVPWVNTNTTSSYYFANGVNGFTVRNQDNQSQFVKVIPDIPSNITGSGTPNCFAIFDSEHSLYSALSIGEDKTLFLRNDGTWAHINNASHLSAGLMSKDDKIILDSLRNYNLPIATDSTLGGVKVGAISKGRLYALKLDSSGNAYVDVPWTDTNTTYSAGTGLKLTGTTFSVDHVEAPQKCSDAPIAELTGIVYSGSKTEATATWTSPGSCIVTVSTYLRTDISSCGSPYPRYVRFKKAESTAYQNVVTMRTKKNYTATFICKKNDQIQITGYCSSSHGTEYHISGTTLA